jgi:transcriptional regulator with PAS, ATPase and Fis domain
MPKYKLKREKTMLYRKILIEAILKRDGNICKHCNNPLIEAGRDEKVVFDHIVEFDKLQLLHKECRTIKNKPNYLSGKTNIFKQFKISEAKKALAETDNNISQAAFKLGISIGTMRNWIERYDLIRDCELDPEPDPEIE